VVSTNPLVLEVLDKPAATAFNPLNAELIPICHLLALLGAHHIFHVSRIRNNLFPIPLVREMFFKGFNNSDIITQQQK